MYDPQECYKGPISVELDGLPSICLESFNPLGNKSCNNHAKPKRIKGLLLSTQRRCFTLNNDWSLTLGGVDYKPELNGKIIIPVRCHTGEKPVRFDGASVPAPWLISFVSLGILRPLGVMLVGSIVHDFAYQNGYLEVIDSSGNQNRIYVEREIIDRLFRDIISTVNQLPVVGWIAWFFVRVGWLFGIKYDGQPFGGKPPHLVLASVIVICGAAFLYFFEGGSFQVQRLTSLLSWIFGGYIVLWGTSAIALKFFGRNHSRRAR